MQHIRCIAISNKKIVLKNLGAHLKKLREAKNLTQFDVCCRINKDRQSLQRIESGNSNPTIYYLMELSEGLEVDIKEIVNFRIAEKRAKVK